jgi:hypothetical protein
MNDKLVERIRTLHSEGKKAKEIAETVNREGFRNSNGKDVQYHSIYNIVKMMKYSRAKSPKKTEMITLPVTETSHPQGKVLMIVGSFEDIEKIMEKFVA